MEGERRQPKRLRKGPPAASTAAPAPAGSADGAPAGSAQAPAASDACGICLEAPQERGVLNCCDHMFCFECIMEWAKVTNRCPLCKAKFNTVTPRALKEGAGKPHKRSVYRVLDREQRVEWEPEEGEFIDDDGDDEGDEDSFIVPDDEEEAAEEDAVWRPGASVDQEEEEEEEEEAVFSDEGDSDAWGEAEADDDLSDAQGSIWRPLQPIHAAPRRSRRAPKPAARPRAAPAPAAPTSPIRRYLPPAQRPAPAPAVPKPPARPASAKQRADRVEITTPDGRTISVRRSKYSATPAPPREPDADSWTLLERLRTSGGGSGGTAAAKPEAVRRPNKRRGGASTHALIAHAMPRISFQRTASVQSSGAPAPAPADAGLARGANSLPSLPPSAPAAPTPQPPPPLSRSATVPAPAPSTPPRQVIRSALSASVGANTAATAVVPPTPPGESREPPPTQRATGSASPVAIAASPPRDTPPSSASSAASGAVSSPFRGDPRERAALKHTVAERVKRILTPIYRSNRISLVQFKVIARAATESFMREEGRGADLREHLRRQVERELGVPLAALERGASQASE